MLRVLVIALLIKLRILLLSNTFYFCLLLFTFIYVVINIIKYNQLPNINQTFTIKGIVIYQQINDNYQQIVIKNKYHYLLNTNNFNIKPNDVVKITGLVTKPAINTTINGFNYRNYCHSKNIHYLIKPEKIQIIKKKTYLFRKIKSNIRNYLTKQKNNIYNQAFILADSTSIDKKVMASYRYNGISHLLAISGLHVALLVLILKFILKRFKQINLILIIIFLIFFNFITGFLPSIMRATMAFIYQSINKKMAFACHRLHIFILTIITNLILFPHQIYQIGFWYSYIISFYLIISFKYLTGNYLIKSLKLSILATLSSFPISLYTFYQFNLLGIIYNLFFIPLVSFIIYPGTLLCAIFPYFYPLLKPFIILMEQTSLWLEQFDFGLIEGGKPLFIIIIIYYLLLTIGIIKKKRAHLIFALCLWGGQYLLLNNKYFEVHFLDVGQGDAIFIRSINNQATILIDTGGEPTYKKDTTYFTGQTVINFLKSINVKQIDYLILTHGDDDHAGNSPYIINNIKVNYVIFNVGDNNDLERKIIKILKKKKINYSKGLEKININEYKLQSLNTKDCNDENNNSNVIYLNYSNYKFLFMGDAGVEVEEELIQKYNLKNIDVLKVGHHGSKTSSGKEFINEVNPKHSIISVGKNNRYGHPNKEVLNNLEQSKIYRTDQDGSIMFKIKNNKLRVETCSP